MREDYEKPSDAAWMKHTLTTRATEGGKHRHHLQARDAHGSLAGGSLCASLLAAGLADVVEVAVMPVLLRGGIPLVASGSARARLVLTHSHVRPSGIVRPEYDVQRQARQGSFAAESGAVTPRGAPWIIASSGAPRQPLRPRRALRPRPHESLPRSRSWTRSILRAAASSGIFFPRLEKGRWCRPVTQRQTASFLSRTRCELPA